MRIPGAQIPGAQAPGVAPTPIAVPTIQPFQPAASDDINAIKNQIKMLGTNTKAGEYFQEAQVPVEIAQFREDMLKLANINRRDPDFRKKDGEKEAGLFKSWDKMASVDTYEFNAPGFPGSYRLLLEVIDARGETIETRVKIIVQ